ncbi:VaFE repeat-containing surface-anchored protein, partial [Bacillus cereus]|nr:VaFE repeat-containing surface-anchored protein [Bacillus cereus]
KDVEGKDIVVFEDLYQDSLLVATHSDIEDKGQTVNFVKPEVKTTATNKEDGLKNIHSNKTVTIQDKVEYKDLIVGKEYVVKGKLMDKATNEPFLVDGKEVTSETKFTAEDKNGSVILDFTFEAKGVEGKEVVVFEDLYNEDILIATHSDIEDKDQTVEFVKPEVGTKATNKADGGKELHTNKSVTIQDTVDYKGLIVDKEYVVKGKLMDKETNKPLLVNDKEVTAEAKFTAKKETGSVTLDFTFDATGLEGKEVVVFEDLYQDNVLVATHSDITDEGQTVKFVKPEVKTTATNKENGSKELDANKSVTVTDKVEYHDLIVGKEYVVKGKLMDKATNKPLIINGIEVTSETKFTAKEKNGSVNLDFTFDATELQGKELVVFEDLYQDNVLVATHSDINDVNQTVKVKVKPVQPKPEQPKPEQPKPQKKPVPQTGSDSNFGTTMSILMGIIALALGGVFVFTRKNKAE